LRKVIVLPKLSAVEIGFQVVLDLWKPTTFALLGVVIVLASRTLALDTRYNLLVSFVLIILFKHLLLLRTEQPTNLNRISFVELLLFIGLNQLLLFLLLEMVNHEILDVLRELFQVYILVVKELVDLGLLFLGCLRLRQLLSVVGRLTQIARLVLALFDASWDISTLLTEVPLLLLGLGLLLDEVVLLKQLLVEL
jgi:hypothetical protein